MKIKCEWCGSWINDFDQVCPNCNGINNHYKRQSTGVPQTIQELKEWAAAKNLPLSSMRTYIGEDYRGPKAFGIYKDEATGTFIVYKNKADGTRSVRYQGTDEAYAVNELYLKMKERVATQKAHPRNVASRREKSRKRRKSFVFVYCAMIFGIVWISLAASVLTALFHHSPSTGYYRYADQSYYYYDGGWYLWQDDSWTTAPASSWMKSDYEEYYDSYSYSSDADYDNFRDSPYYVEDSNSGSDDSGWDSDWDSDDSWDSNDSWDDSWDDWDSDW